ncbi:MAG: hypothetical protein ICV84_12505 [Flavisolibacter sp.]|nr:hypothetical protein [Flavisolibacter sp.]
MKKGLLVILLLPSILFAFAQDLPVLQQQYKAANTYKDKVYALDALANYYTWTEGGYSEANAYGKQMINLAVESKSKELLALAYVLNGIRVVETFATTESEKEGRDYFAQAIQIARENKLPFYEAAAYIGLSGIQFQLVAADGDELLKWGKQALTLSTAIANDSLRVMSLIAIAIGQKVKKDNITAFHHFTDAIELAETINDTYLLAYCYRAFARFYDEIADYNNALVYFLKAIDILRKKKNLTHRDLNWLYWTQWNTTWAYLHNKELEQAKSSANKLIELSKEYNLPSTYRIAPVHQQLRLYIEKGKFEKAKDLISQYPDYEVFYKNHDFESNLYGLKASIYRNLGQPDSADYYYRLNLAAVDKSIPMWSPGQIRAYGNFLLERGKMTEAIQYLESAKTRSEQFKNLNNLVSTYQDLDKAYYRAGNIRKAYTYKSLYIQYKDSLAQLGKEKEIALLQVHQEQKKLEQERRQKQAIAEYRNRMRTFGLISGLAVLLIVAAILWQNNRQKQKVNIKLHQQKAKTEQTLNELKSTQVQLIQKEKMAFLGELTAGIAHEIRNPLNFVKNFSELSVEQMGELQSAISEGDKKEALTIAINIKNNLQRVLHHEERADSIVKSMLQHSRTTAIEKEPTDINALADEYLRLSYHGMRAKEKGFTALLETHYDTSIGKINIIPQDIGRVLLNLFNNAFYSTSEKKKLLNGTYEPAISISTKKVEGKVEICIKDNGIGIPQKIVHKIYQPFFTTKPAGDGTGLGLSLSYDIITKGYGGELKVNSKEGEYAEFIIQLPV